MKWKCVVVATVDDDHITKISILLLLCILIVLNIKKVLQVDSLENLYFNTNNYSVLANKVKLNEGT